MSAGMRAIPGFFLIAISPVLSGIAATGHAIGDVFEAIATLDVVGSSTLSSTFQPESSTGCSTACPAPRSASSRTSPDC